MSNQLNNDVTENLLNDSVKELADALKKISPTEEIELDGTEAKSNDEIDTSSFKPVGTNLPEKPSVWTKIKNALFYEIKVELTPYQQKVEDEINEFLHQEVTWNSFKGFLFKEVPITYKGKRVF